MTEQHETIKQIIHLLAEPTTSFTFEEIWCRLAYDWQELEPLLLEELQSDRPEVVTLVLRVIELQARRIGALSDDMIKAAKSCLSHPDRLVRQAVIGAVESIGDRDPDVIEHLREIMRSADEILAVEAAEAWVVLSPEHRDEAKRLIESMRDLATEEGVQGTLPPLHF